MRPTIRLRLTLLHTLLFFMTALVLVAGIYLLTGDSVALHLTDPRSRIERAVGLPSGALSRDRGLLPRGEDLTMGARRPTLLQLAVGAQTRTRSQLLTRLLLFSAALLIVMTLVSLGLGWVMAGRILRPLRRITDRARSLSETDLHERIALGGRRDELRELADTFDDMMSRLDAASSQRLFVANASHELRTPLTRIRTKLDVTLSKPEVTTADLDDMAATIRDAVDRSSSLIDSLLTLARSQGELNVKPVALDVIGSAVAAGLQKGAKDRGIRVETAIAPCLVSGDPLLLEHFVTNLVDNAIKHNVAGGWVKLWVEPRDGTALFRIANSGAVLAGSTVDELFVPLHRGQADRLHAPNAGYGLGLSIAKAVVEAHGGSISASPVPEGGLAVEAVLPAIERSGEPATLARA
jgi:signal transduction histidine kinase